MAATHVGSSKQFIGEEMIRENFVADSQFVPCIARISTSSPFPTIILDLTENRPNSGLHLQPPHLAAGSFHHSIPLPNNTGQDHLSNHAGLCGFYKGRSQLHCSPGCSHIGLSYHFGCSSPRDAQVPSNNAMR